MPYSFSDKEVWYCMDRLLDLEPELSSPEYRYGLNTPSANVFLLCSTHGAISNGGLHYFFEVAHPGTPPYDLIADVYRHIGSPKTADCISEAAKAFPFTDPHLKPDQRLDKLTQLEEKLEPGEGAFDHLDDILFHEQDMNAQILKYMRKHIASLPHGRGPEIV